MCNIDIRNEIKSAGLKLWQIAYQLGIKSDATFSRKLRLELSQKEKARIRDAIQHLKTEQEAAPI